MFMEAIRFKYTRRQTEVQNLSIYKSQEFITSSVI